MVTITRQDVPVDSNGDGVPDAWLADTDSPTSTDGGSVAPNGYTYYESYMMNLDPNDANTPAFLMVHGLTKPFSFNAPADGRQYMVQFTTNLFSPFRDIGQGGRGP